MIIEILHEVCLLENTLWKFIKYKSIEIVKDKLEIREYILSQYCHRLHEINYLKTNSLSLQEKKN